MAQPDDAKYKTYTRRAGILAGGMLVLSSALVGRMYYLQVVSRSQYELLADENRISLRLLAPERGKVLDRYGRPLALNRSDYRVNLIPEQAEDVRRTLNTLGRYVPLTERDYTRILRAMKRQRAFLPVAVAENLDWETFANVNINIPDLPGIQPDVGTTRFYPERDNFAHLVGYVGSVSEKDLGLGKDPLLELPGFKIGKNGMERELEHLLRGQAGNSRVEVNALGRVIRELSRQDSRPGRDIHLTIDRDIQNFAAARVRDHSAAVVVMDVHNGDVLALASTPAFDPNDFNLGISRKKWNELLHDQRKPLVNKPVAGQYPPGSTFKMVVALAALEHGVIREDEKVFCNGKYQLGNHTFHCWRRQGHGHVSLVKAIAASCDVYFYDIARRVGIDKIRKMALRLGLGDRFDLAIPGEARGLIPSEGWKLATQGVRWQGGDTVNAGIGQGYVLATPLQLAVMTARLANGGRAVVPRLLQGGEEAEMPAASALGIPAYHLKLVQRGMEAVMNEVGGTAFAARIKDKDMRIAGKSGTSQVRRIKKAERESGIRKNEEKPWEERDHALFVSYGPVDKPRYAISVLVEHGGGGSGTAAPVARDVLEFIMKRDRDRQTSGERQA